MRDNCRLHFVAVTRHAWPNRNDIAAAVWPTSLRRAVRALKEEVPMLRENPRVLSHWFGRVGGDTDERREWSIEFSIR